MGKVVWKQEGFSLVFDEPTVYVDNQARKRSGHMSHAMAEFRENCVIDFNSNCSAVLCEGHWPHGVIEYRVSHDAGETWGEVRTLPYSVEALYDGLFTVSVEKAVAVDGRVVAFCLRNKPCGCEPWRTPTWICSDDEGETWSQPKELCGYRGRIYDARAKDGKIYVLLHCNDAQKTFTGNDPEHVYRLYVSEDRGGSFRELSVVPIPGYGRGYGAMIFRPDGSLAVYAYNVNDERHMDWAVSRDGGATFPEIGQSFLDKRIRNPQISLLDGTYILQGRAGGKGFVFYTSADGLSWSEGLMYEPDRGPCYYSNGIVLNDPRGGKRLLVQYSDIYERFCVNAMHMWIRKVPDAPARSAGNHFTARVTGAPHRA